MILLEEKVPGVSVGVREPGTGWDLLQHSPGQPSGDYENTRDAKTRQRLGVGFTPNGT